MSNNGTRLMIMISSSRGEMYPHLDHQSRVNPPSSRHRPLSLAPARNKSAPFHSAPPPQSSQAPQPGVTLPMQRAAAPSN